MSFGNTPKTLHIYGYDASVSSAKNWLGQLRQDSRSLRPASIGTGALGDLELVDVLLQLMQVDDVACVVLNLALRFVREVGQRS